MFDSSPQRTIVKARGEREPVKAGASYGDECVVTAQGRPSKGSVTELNNSGAGISCYGPAVYISSRVKDAIERRPEEEGDLL